MGEGGYFPTAVSLIGDLFASNRRGLAIGLHGVCTTLGGSAGYAVGGILGQRFGWRIPFMLAVIPGLMLASVLYFFFQEPPRGAQSPKAAGEAAPAERRPYLESSRSHRLLISITACLASFAMTGMNTFLPMYLVAERHISIADAGVLTGAFYAASMIGQLSGGLLSDRVGIAHSGRPPALRRGSLLCSPVPQCSSSRTCLRSGSRSPVMASRSSSARICGAKHLRDDHR